MSNQHKATPTIKNGQAQGDLLGSGDIAFNLYGETAQSGERLAAEQSAAEDTQRAAAEFDAKHQPELPTVPALIRGRVVRHDGARYPSGRGIVLRVHGTFDPAKERKIGGLIHVVDANNDGRADIVWPECSRPHLSQQLHQGLLHSLPYRITAEMATEEEIKTALETVEKADLTRKLHEQQAAIDRAARKAAFLRQFSGLLTPADKAGRISSHALGAKNLKAELAAAFPGIKFSARSESFSGGDSIDISWQLGPTTKQVDAITGKYKEGHFNGMDDIYEYDTQDNPWPEIFGGAKYVHTHREHGPAFDVVCAALCEHWQLEKPSDGRSWYQVRRKDDPGGHDITTHARELLEADQLPAGATVTGIESLEEERIGQGHRFAAYYRVTFTAPAAALQASLDKTAAIAEFEGKPAVQFNADKFGIEIRFPAKPAAAVLSMLKSHGWRWSRFSSCWYHRATSEAVNAAAQMASLTPEQRTELERRLESEGHARGARGMEEACGIA